MASLTLADAASRIAPMADEKKPKRWLTKAAKAASLPHVAEDEPPLKRERGSLSAARTSNQGRHNLFKKG